MLKQDNLEKNKSLVGKKTENLKCKYIFVVGGVMSGVGKGVSASSLGQLLQARGYKLSAIKMDPYINVDAGTMDPKEHGEVFVTEDGDETDQDIGNYERFLNRNIYKINYMTTGRVYQSVIAKERNLEYGGKCVQVVPHIPLEINRRIKLAAKNSGAEIMIIEIGGTVGEYENSLFLEAARMLKLYQPKDVAFVMVSYLPAPSKIGEQKTKPTQHAVRSLNSAGIQADFLIARSEREIDDIRREKIALHCNIALENVIPAPDADSIYDIPLNFAKEKFDLKVLDKLSLSLKNHSIKNQAWQNFASKIKDGKKELNIAILGEKFPDAYISTTEALKHAAVAKDLKINLSYLDKKSLKTNQAKALDKIDALLIAQYWSSTYLTLELEVLKYIREQKIPFLGLGHGFSVAVIEASRNLLKLKEANSIEIDSKTPEPVLGYPKEKETDCSQEKEKLYSRRLGAYSSVVKEGSRLAKAYKTKEILERHRHLAEFNTKYQKPLERLGFSFSAHSKKGNYLEVIELDSHPFYLASIFQAQYTSRPLRPHPLFLSFLEASLKEKERKLKKN